LLFGADVAAAGVVELEGERDREGVLLEDVLARDADEAEHGAGLVVLLERSEEHAAEAVREGVERADVAHDLVLDEGGGAREELQVRHHAEAAGHGEVAVELDVEEGAWDVSELVTVDRDARVERQRETEALLVPELPLHADVRRVEAEVVLSLVDGHAVRPRHELAPLRVAARQPDARLERREEAIVELRIEEDLVAIEEAHAVDV